MTYFAVLSNLLAANTAQCNLIISDGCIWMFEWSTLDF